MIWQCVGNKPVKWVFGDQIGDRMENCCAGCERMDNGNWSWWAHENSGMEPSRDLAIESADKAFSFDKSYSN